VALFRAAMTQLRHLINTRQLLPRSRERWRSIVMSMSVCMCVCFVCLSVCQRAYLLSHARDLYQIFVHVACGRGLVLLRQGDEISRGRGNSGPFKSIGNLRCSRRCRVRCKRDNSIANSVMQQKGSFSMPGKRK